ncbi:phosphoglycerate mutase-like protein 1 isoform X1 [Gastrolobium bilobum]|uniref:phosphoglycerate mutase-like protein 1 isoform X1 n=1 Tax=Gastrolobium bilobum TaxID=150636 RepID=UPI002AB1CE94|nr:phosphoglycerate mutase-like protein 1 isoform X1 [Gastrolobium bilobum]
MDTAAGQSLYPLHHCKTVHLVRHAQGVHNVEGEKNHDAYLSYDHFDAHLTPLGWKQEQDSERMIGSAREDSGLYYFEEDVTHEAVFVEKTLCFLLIHVGNLQKHVKACELFSRIELVIVSPLLRTMQTAVGVFGGEAYTDAIDKPPLMMENVGQSDHLAVSSVNCPPFIAVELCREQMGVHPCDKRRTISEYRKMFPAIDFSLVESDDDILWSPDIREKKEDVAARGLKLLEWLWTRKEKEIAVVTHSSFLFNTLSAFGNDCHPNIKSAIRTHFANCELRSVVLVDRGMIGSNEPTTNYPGKIPRGPDLPSDAAD